MTADPNALRALADRIEAAEGPSPFLSREIGVALGFRMLIRLPTGAGIAWLSPDGGGLFDAPPDWLSSLDAAVSLVPESAMWRLGNDGKGRDPSRFYAEIVHCWRYGATAVTPALALTAAALRARAAMMEGGE